MKILISGLIICFLISNSFAKLLFFENAKRDKYFFKMTKCVSDLIYKFCEGRTLVLLEQEITDSFGEQLLISGLNATVDIRREPLDNGTNKKLFILQPDIRTFNFTLYNRLLSQEEKGSYFLIVWPLHPFKYLKHYIAELHDKFWQNRILRGASLVPTKEDHFNVYTYFPYSEEICGSGKIIKKVDECTSGEYKNNFKIFSGIEKLKSFHKCVVKCFGNIQYPESVLTRNTDGTWNVQGNIAYLLQTLQDHYNLTLRVVKMFDLQIYDWFYYNVSAETVMERVEQNAFEFGFGSFTFLNTNNRDKFEYGLAPNPECITWAAPVFAGKFPEFWRAYLKEFSFLCWCFLGLAICIATSLVIAGKILEGNELSPLEIISHLLMITFSFITMPSALKSKMVSINFFVFQWSVWGLILRCAYEASLGSIMTVPIPIGQIGSSEEILENNMKVGGGIMMYEVLQKVAENNQVLSALANKFEIIPPNDGKDVLRNISYYRNLAVLQPLRYTKYTSYKLARLHDMIKPVIIVKPCLLQTFSTPVMVRKGSIMSDLLNTFTQRLFESGIVRYWRKKDSIRMNHGIKPRKLNLGKIHGIFILYFIGLTVAFSVLLIEIIHSRINNYFIRQKLKKRIVSRLIEK